MSVAPSGSGLLMGDGLVVGRMRVGWGNLTGIALGEPIPGVGEMEGLGIAGVGCTVWGLAAGLAVGETAVIVLVPRLAGLMDWDGGRLVEVPVEATRVGVAPRTTVVEVAAVFVRGGVDAGGALEVGTRAGGGMEAAEGLEMAGL